MPMPMLADDTRVFYSMETNLAKEFNFIPRIFVKKQRRQPFEKKNGKN
jgi:hypothetical protein